MRARGFLEALRLLLVAVGFLTRIPVPSTDVGADDLRRASAFFPLVGLGVAGVGVAARAGVEPIWGAGVGTIAAIAAMILVTGAFHEDGLADTADGLWGGRDPAARLAIIRDSRIGTYGTVALIIAIALRASLLLPLDLADFARAVACGHVLGRASPLLLARLLPAASDPPAASSPAASDPRFAGSSAASVPRSAGSPAASGASPASSPAATAPPAAGVRGKALAVERPRLGVTAAARAPGGRVSGSGQRGPTGRRGVPVR